MKDELEEIEKEIKLKKVITVTRPSETDSWNGEKEILYKKVMQLAGNHDYVIKSIINSDNTEFYLNKEILSKIKTPTLIIWGREDETVSIDIGRKINEYIKGSKLYFLLIYS